MSEKAVVIDKSADFGYRVERETERALTESALVMEGQMKLRCPVDTGRLRASLTSSSSLLTSGYPEGEAEVGTNVEYAAYVEYGTRKMRAQPYMRTGAEGSKSSIQKIFKKRLGSIRFTADNL